MNPNRYIKKYIKLAFLLAALFANSAQAQVDSPLDPASTSASIARNPNNGPLSPIAISNPDWKFFTGRYELDADLGDNKMTLNFSLRMKRDSIMWFSVSIPSIGIQVAKGLITNDTAKILDLYNKTYYYIPVSQLANLLGTKLDLQKLQATFMGHPLVDSGSIIEIPGKVDPNKSIYITPIQNTDYAVFTAVVPKTNEVVKSSIISSINPKQSFVINNSSYQKQENINVPTLINLIMKDAEKNAQLDFSLKTARFDSIPSYPFVVSNEYTIVTNVATPKK